jgi:hypothetical protein
MGSASSRDMSVMDDESTGLLSSSAVNIPVKSNTSSSLASEKESFAHLIVKDFKTAKNQHIFRYAFISRKSNSLKKY